MVRLVIILLATVAMILGVALKPTVNYAGNYLFSDSLKYWCPKHSLTLHSDSTFEYYSKCLNSKGKWRSGTNNTILLNSTPLKSFFVHIIRENKEIKIKKTDVKLLGVSSKIKMTPGGIEILAEKPILCEEVKFISEHGSKIAYTDNQGVASVDMTGVDTIRFMGMSSASKTDHYIVLKVKRNKV